MSELTKCLDEKNALFERYRAAHKEIRRLSRERDELREALTETVVGLTHFARGAGIDVDPDWCDLNTPARDLCGKSECHQVGCILLKIKTAEAAIANTSREPK